MATSDDKRRETGFMRIRFLRFLDFFFINLFFINPR